jgi:hypothetical protein
VVIAHVVFPHGFEKTEGSFDIGMNKRLGVSNGIIVVTFSRIMHDCIALWHQRIKESSVADIP